VVTRHGKTPSSWCRSNVPRADQAPRQPPGVLRRLAAAGRTNRPHARRRQRTERPPVRYLLDTFLISELVKAHPAKSVVGWLMEQREEDLYLSVLTLGEIQKGIARWPTAAGRRDSRPGSTMTSASAFAAASSASPRTSRWHGAAFRAALRRGRPLPVIDALIAASAAAIDATVVTGTNRGFAAAGAGLSTLGNITVSPLSGSSAAASGRSQSPRGCVTRNARPVGRERKAR